MECPETFVGEKSKGYFNIHSMIQRAKNLYYLLLCLISFFAFGRADKKGKEPAEVIIFQNAKLGYMVCTTPVFRAIKTTYPKCKVTVVGTKIHKELLQYNSDVDDYIVHDDRETSSTVWKIKEKAAKIAILTSPGFINLAILYLSKVPLIVAPVIRGGWSPLETRSYKILRMLVETHPHRMGSYAPRE